MLVPPVIITSFNDDGTLRALSEYELAPKIYPKCVFSVPFNVAPTNGSIILVKLLQPSNADEPILMTLFGITIRVKLSQS